MFDADIPAEEIQDLDVTCRRRQEDLPAETNLSKGRLQ